MSTTPVTPDDDLIWAVRTFIYEHFVATARTPHVTQIAVHFALPLAEAEGVLHALHDRHALFLEPGTTEIQLANPFSAIPTNFITEANGQRYWANCAWDSFGVIVAVGAGEGVVHAQCAGDGLPLTVRVENGQVIDNGAVAHVLVPFQHWYDDLVFT